MGAVFGEELRGGQGLWEADAGFRAPWFACSEPQGGPLTGPSPGLEPLRGDRFGALRHPPHGGSVRTGAQGGTDVRLTGGGAPRPNVVVVYRTAHANRGGSREVRDVFHAAMPTLRPWLGRCCSWPGGLKCDRQIIASQSLVSLRRFVCLRSGKPVGGEIRFRRPFVAPSRAQALYELLQPLRDPHRSHPLPPSDPHTK